MKHGTIIQCKKLKPIEWMYLLMVVGMAIAPNTIIGYFFCICFIGYIAWLNKGKFKTSLYFFIELVMILYLVIQLFIGINYEKAQFTGIRLLIISLVFDFSLYQLITRCGIYRAADLYATGNIIGDLILLAFYSGTIFHEGGLSASQFKGISLFKIGGVASVNIGWVNVVAIVLLWPNYLKFRDKNTLLKVGVLLLFSILTGRRKIFLLIITSLIIGTYLFYSSIGLKKAIKGIAMGGVAVLIGWILLMKVPTLYNFIGYRLQVALEAVLRSNNGTDSSINMRNELAEKAIYTWKNNIYLGQGYNAFSAVYNGGGYYSHNNYYELLVSFGVVGTAIYYAKYVFIFVKLLASKIQKRIQQWDNTYYIINLIAFCFLEYYQITYIYRNLTVILIFALYVANNGIDDKYGKKYKLSN